MISDTVSRHEYVGAYLKGNRTLQIFEDINVSLIVEKDLNGQKIPVPLVLEKADKKSIEAISEEIREARDKPFSDKDIVLQKKTS